MSALTLLSIRARRFRIAVRIGNAVLSIRMRRWLGEPDEPRKVRIDHYATSRRPRVEEDDRFPGSWPPPWADDGLAGSRVPRRPVPDPGSASATLSFDEYQAARRW
jgi:hypothetical protein